MTRCPICPAAGTPRPARCPSSRTWSKPPAKARWLRTATSSCADALLACRIFAIGAFDHAARIGQIGAPDTLPASVAQLRLPGARTIVTEAGDTVPADDGGPVQAHELSRVQLALQPRNGLVEQKRARTDMKAHVIAFSLDQVDVAGCHADDFGPVWHPEFAGPGCRRHGRRRRRAVLAADAHDRALEAVGRHRLEQ